MKVIKINLTVSRALDYIAQAYKTDSGTLVDSNVGPCVDMKLIADQYDYVRELSEAAHTRGKRGSVLAYHVIQSFKPGEVSPEEAHEIGLEFARQISEDGAHQYVIATHVDRDHIHNHIIFNAVNQETLHRYQMPLSRLGQWRAWSDDLCRAHGLSVIEDPKRGVARAIGSVYASVRGHSKLDELRDVIDQAVRRANSFENMRALLTDLGVEVAVRGRHITFRDVEGMKRPVRGVRLGAAYTEAALIARIGRASVSEFVVFKPDMIKPHGKNTVSIQLPGAPKGTRLVVPRQACVDHGGHVRVYLDDERMNTIIDRWGCFDSQIKTPKLYRYFAPPEVMHLQRDKASANMPTRGITAAQKRYYRWVDMRAAALHETFTRYNLNADLKAMSTWERRDVLVSAQRKHTEALKDLEAAVVALQKATDSGEGALQARALVENLEAQAIEFGDVEALIAHSIHTLDEIERSPQHHGRGTNRSGFSAVGRTNQR